MLEHLVPATRLSTRVSTWCPKCAGQRVGLRANLSALSDFPVEPVDIHAMMDQQDQRD